MKKIIVSILFSLVAVSCIKMTVIGSSTTSKITRLNREIPQVEADLNLKKHLKYSINSGKKKFLYSNGLKDFGSYNLNVIEGRVLLTGVVHHEVVKDYIVKKITENIKVRELLNELNVSEDGISSFSDFWVKRSIIAKIFFKTKIKSLNYEISVVNGSVYIIGIAENKEELTLLTKTISTVRGVKEVISYVITVDSDKKIKIEFL